MLDSVVIGTEYRDTFTVIDPEGDTLAISRGNTPFSTNLTIVNDSIVVFTPAWIGDTGTHAVAVQARDLKRNDYITLQWTITVVDSNRAPSFSWAGIAPEDTASSGSVYTDTLHATDGNGDALVFSFIDSISGMSLIDSIISWTPSKTDVGMEDTVRVRVSDNRGKYDTLSRPIRVYMGFDSLGSILLSQGPRHTVISGNYVYVAAGDSGLRIIDVSDPAAPTFVGSYVPGGQANDVAVNGNYAYVVAESLFIVDVSIHKF